MAGTILVGEKSGLAMSTVEFDYLVERIRHAFNEGDEKFAQEIYEPLDAGGMTFISVAEAGVDGFRAFVRAARQACSRAATEDGYAQHSKWWGDLLCLLERDPRYAAGLE
jgi:hypothetical protein